MKLYELKKGETRLKEVPEAPETVKGYGKDCWKLYCGVMLDQGRLFKEYLPGLKQLCWLEEQLHQEQLKKDGEYTRVIKEFSVEARQYRKAYGLTEESRPKKVSGSAEPEQGSKSKSEKASGWSG